jgi:signal transduction histidine kinase
LPYVFVLEVPRSTLFLEPRATLRGIMLVSLLVFLGGVFTVWALARRITRPLGELTVAAEGIAQGDYRRRVEVPTMSDEVERLGTSFNRMASQVEASQRELAAQVNQAISVSEELEQANKQLKEITMDAEEARDAALTANQAKSDFLAVMSHELRTPLNAIGGYADIMNLGIYGEMNEQQKNALTRIARSQQTLLALINDVLNFAKLEAGEVRYAISDVPLAPAIESLEDLVGPQLRDRRMRYMVATCSPELAVRADAEKLQQILINLLSNAIKFTPEGGTISLHCDVDDRKVHINVTDSGIGIAADRLERIFDPFIQVGRALNRPHEGVGLGLSISRDLALAMGGALSVRSTPGEGSTFTLTLDKA